MSPKFGTSGVRGLVSELNETIVSSYVASFAHNCDIGGRALVGWDLRSSSPQISKWVIRTLQSSGIEVVSCGVLPTPALAFAAQQLGAGAIMVTGSHIPADRNGIKFYTVQGEISKVDEKKITLGLDQKTSLNETRTDLADQAETARNNFIERYTAFKKEFSLSGLRVGVYQHSSVARDLLTEIIERLGAEAIPLERTEQFVPVDTEAVAPESKQKFSSWCQENELDALISTDGDADRPMLTDASGKLVPGDVLGTLTAQFLKADIICTPVSSNSMIASMPDFESVHLTRIGSPYVVAAIESVLKTEPNARVVGFEANGGFLLGYRHKTAGGELAPLLTRDCVLPIVATLAAARVQKLRVDELVATLPPRFTAADRIAGIATSKSQAFIGDLIEVPQKRADFFKVGSTEKSINVTDGLRVTFENGEVVHLRPSGNAPEFRCYAEAETFERATHLAKQHLDSIAKQLVD